LPSEPRWLPIGAVIEINRIVVRATGERHFLRDSGLLDSALARPQNAFAYGEEDVIALAVRLLAGIAMAHAFEQGNKRTAL
jgi:death on curing protein